MWPMKAGYNEDWERLRHELPDPFGTDSPPESETWIVEREPNRHDEPEEFYEQLAHKMRRVYKWLFIDNHSLNSTFDEYGIDENSSEHTVSESGSWPRYELVTVQAEVHREDEVTPDLVNKEQGCDKLAHVQRNKFSGSPILGSSRVVHTREPFNDWDGSITTEPEHIPEHLDIPLRSSTPKTKRRLSYDRMSDCTYTTFCSHKKRRNENVAEHDDSIEVNSIDAREFVTGVSSPSRHIHSMETIVPEEL